jgi:hypothetical protein
MNDLKPESSIPQNRPGRLGCRSTGRLPWLLLALLALAIPGRAGAQSYSIDWYTVDGGGGTSSGGIYSVSGTVGQPDAGGPMTGGNFSITGGFWSLYSVVQLPGSPLLAIQLTTTNTVVLTWPSSASGFGLQRNTNAATTNWTAAGPLPTVNGSNWIVVLPLAPGNDFFRLKK